MLHFLCCCTLQQTIAIKHTGLLVIQPELFCFQPTRQSSILLMNLQLHTTRCESKTGERQRPLKEKEEQRPIHKVVTEKTRTRSLLAQS